MPIFASFGELTGIKGALFTTAQARAAGLTPSDLSRAAIRGELVRLRRGVYTTAEIWQSSSPRDHHQLKVLAYQWVHPEAVACGVSAAILLGLPTPGSEPPIEPVLLMARDAARRGAIGRRSNMVVRRAWLGGDQVVRLQDGARVTSAVRTVWDCARHWPRPWGLAIADAAVTKGMVTAEELLARSTASTTAPGAGRMQWVAAHTLSGIESPLESLARATIVLAGLPEPTPQVPIPTRLGTYRVDLLDKAHRIVTEADGKLKYEEREDLWNEKRREDALKETGLQVMRFTMNEFRSPNAWLRIYTRHVLRAQR